MQQFINTFFILCLMCTTIFVQAGSHSFGEERGVILYDIYGGAELTSETNLSIKGKARLQFKEWGNVKIEEENGIILTTGAIKHKQMVRRFVKQGKDKITTTDYENEQLLERPWTHNDTEIDETEGLVLKGKALVSGMMCDVWVGNGIQKSLYKNIVLKLEFDVMNVHYVKVASKIIWDSNNSNYKCEVPDYPVQEFSLFNNNLKTKNLHKIENFCKVLKDVSYNLSDMNRSSKIVSIDNPERKKFINLIGQDIYQKQMTLLPELLISMKQTRECLQIGENPFEANQCIEHFSRMKESLGTHEDNYIILWDDMRKNELLDKLEDELIYLQSRMSCVNRAKNITDLSTCLK